MMSETSKMTANKMSAKLCKSFDAVSRRGVLTGAAGLSFAFAFGVSGSDQSLAQSIAAINAYIRIRPDGSVLIFAPAPEMGQATNTTIPLIIAEELDADWSRVKIETAPVAAPYNHPVFRAQFVVASLTTRAYWMPARSAGAQARRVLMEAAAARWSVPLTEVSTAPGVVVHTASNRRLSFGEIAGFATVPATLPEIKPEDLKKPADFRLIGKDVARWDVPAKSTGRETYAIDVQVPNMVHAAIARAPVMNGGPKSHNGDEVRKLPGILAVVALEQGVAVVAERVEQALAGRAALKIEWNATPASTFDSDAGLKKYLADARDLAKDGVVGRKTGEIGPALANAARVISGEYTTDYVTHMQMEPLTCVASVTNDAVEIWTGTQWPTKVREDAAKLAGVPVEKVKVNMQAMGGGYGRRAQTEYASEAVLVSKAVGRPVKLMAAREDDVINAHSRPMTAHRIDVGLDADGKVTAWRHRLAADHVVLQVYGQARLDAQKGVDHIVMAHADVPLYDVPNHQAEHIYEESGVRTAAWRGIGAGANAFPIEAIVDDLARLSGQDPVAYRLAFLKDARARATVQAAADMAGWPKARDGASIGMAFARLGVPQLGESLAATVAETVLDRAKGDVRVTRLWCAVDVGLPVQPRNIRQQVEGSLIWGLSSAIKERVTFKNGAVEQSNFTDYPVLRLSEMPQIEIRIIRSGDIPLPVGELGLATVAPAISNAVLAMTGKRLANLPFTPARVLAALNS
ncbi:Aldehyde oxidase/xanthine dehydrogenase, molybdopterin binding [Rhabdaerophilaceae bacterium]